MTLLAEVVASSDAVAATSARSAKVALLSDLLGRIDGEEVPICVAILSGTPRQGRIGVGYAAVYRIPPHPSHPAEAASLTVGDLDRAVDALAAATGGGSSARRRAILAGLLARATAPEDAFIRRLLTGELRQGALAGLMADAVARAAGVNADLTRRALMLSGDLSRTAQIAITGGEAGLRAVGLALFTPVLPMLAAPGSSVQEAIAGCERALVEYKLDGLRVQIHRRGEEVCIYTRNLNDITPTLPGIVDAIGRLPVKQAILDGEALGMGDGGPATFQDTMSRLDVGAAPNGVVTFLFDVLHIDGEDLLDTPLEQRTARLAEIAPELKVPGVLTADPERAARVLADALSAGHEGVVVKDASSLYAAGRRGGAWRKVKPVLTYDLVVLGAEWGHGRRRGRLSNLHLGARDPTTGTFVMVGKTFKGLTDELLSWQTTALLARETDRRGIVVLVAPELVVEIAIDGVQASTRYPGGVALRFARVKRYRSDKDAGDADTIDTLRALLPSRVGDATGPPGP
jgi:DNA ligase-1